MEKKKKKKSQMNKSFSHSLSTSLCGWARGHQERVQLVTDTLQLKVVVAWLTGAPSVASCLGGLRSVETHQVCRGGGGGLNCYK